MEPLNVIIKRGITDYNERQLIINNEVIKFENKNITNNTFTTFTKNEISGYRFGVKWISLEITLGREYVIEILKKDGTILKINFKTYFRYKLQKRYELYLQILNALWEFHFIDIVNDYIDQYNNGSKFQIGNVIFCEKGVTIKTSILKKEGVLIEWNNVRTHDYKSYFSIYSKENPSKINRGYSYLDDWNTNILYSVLRAILDHKNIENYN